MTTPPGGQPPYDPNQPYQPYQQQPYQQPYQQPGYGYQVPDHPKANTAMILGILGLVACGVCAPFAWSIGKRTVAEIDASGGAYGGRGAAQAGYIMGIIGTILLGIAVAFILFYFVIFALIIGGTAASS